jgi:dUTP pyrophosphatase
VSQFARGEPSVGVLSHQQIKNLISGNDPLLTDYVDLESQIQTNGFDMTLKAIATFDGHGLIGLSNQQRMLPRTRELDFDKDGFVDLNPGPYLIMLNEVVQLPDNLMALAKPRSSLLRSGVAIHNAVWDAGYYGRSQALMLVYNPDGFRLAKDSRILQLVFMTLDSTSDSPYDGRYQKEHLSKSQ